jgi:hypothetical protein
MKKLTLTFCALFVVFAVPALFADDGPEKYSGKEKQVMAPAPPVCDWYRAHEWDLSIWGAYAFASDTGTTGLQNFDPIHPDTNPFTFDINTGTTVEPEAENPSERINIGRWSNNEMFGRDNTFGGGADVKYFWNRYFGAGIEAMGLAAKTNFMGGSLGTITIRYPFGHWSPYAVAGVGVVDGGSTLYKFFNRKFGYVAGNVTTENEFVTEDPVTNNHIRGIGQLGVGMEYRVTCHIGLMTEFTWNFIFGQEDHAERLRPHALSGQDVIEDSSTTPPTIISSVPDNNTFVDVIPGHGSDHQDFGMVKCGVTFSY